MELSRFFDDPTGVGNMSSGNSAFSKSSLNIWKFMVHILLNPGLGNFEHYFARVLDKCNCAVVWACTTGYCFCFGFVSSFFLELFLHWSPVAYWAPTDLGSSSFSILSFCLSYYSWGPQSKNSEVFHLSLLQWATFCHHDPSVLGGPTWHGS